MSLDKLLKLFNIQSHEIQESTELNFFELFKDLNNEASNVSLDLVSRLLQSILKFFYLSFIKEKNVGDEGEFLHKTLNFFNSYWNNLSFLIHPLEKTFIYIKENLEGIIKKDLHARRLWIIIDFAFTNLKGMIVDNVRDNGFESIDNLDYREWLKKHGASDLTIHSAPVQAIYGLVFTGKNVHTFAAGTALKGTLRFLFDYKGSISYRMQAGMGDVIMAPVYEVLKKRGVKIHFFHKVKNLKVENKEGRKRISSIKIGKQVHLKNSEYEPLIPVKRLPCWPSFPDYNQIMEGEELKKRNIDLEDYWADWKDVEEFDLVEGKDYDRIVLGISIGAFPYLCKELAESSPSWKLMVEKITTTMTDALQTWTYPDVAGLGWKFWMEVPAVQGTYIEPFDTWADMSELILREEWTGKNAPNNIAYFCGVQEDPDVIPDFNDHEFPARMLEKVTQKAEDFLNQSSGHLWPNAVSDNKFNWDLLVDPKEQIGKKRLLSQYIRVNVQPTERYVLSVKDSTKYRIRENGTEFKNLVITGDWIYNLVLNAGCVESTVTSGIQAANVFLNDPVKILT